MSDYFGFLKEKGWPVSAINPGSDELALTVDDALQALELLRGSQLPVLGGDIMSEEAGHLIYAYQLWGSEYLCLNWYCNKMDGETHSEYCNRSYDMAKKSIMRACEVAKRLGKKCYVVLVT